MSETSPPEIAALDHILSLGYYIADADFAPRTSRRHGYAKLEKAGQLYFGKYLFDNARHRNSIQTEVWWCAAIAAVNERQPMIIRTPQIIDHNTDWYVAEWIQGKPSIAANSSPAELDQFIPAFAECLVQLDSIDARQLPPGPRISSDYSQLDRGSWTKWSTPALAEGFLAPAQLAAAHQLVDDYRKYFSPRLQHGDFVPWHILSDNQQNWWLIDAEHASPGKPRYFDLAYLYSRIFTRMHSPTQAARLLRVFSEISGQSPEHIYPTLLPVMTSRAIGMHFDAMNDLSVTDYRAEAQDLLERCLSRDSERLFQID